MNASSPDREEWAILKALYTLLGCRLYRSHRVPDGRITYFVQSGTRTHTLSTLGDINALATQIRDQLHGGEGGSRGAQ